MSPKHQRRPTDTARERNNNRSLANLPSPLLRLGLFYFYSISLAALASTIPEVSLIDLQFRVVPVPINAAYPFYTLGVIVLTCWLMTCWIDRRPFSSLGLRLGVQVGAYLLLGFGTAFAANVLTRWLMMAAYLQVPAWPFFTLVPAEERPFSPSTLLAVAVYEELYFRSYAFQTVMASLGTVPAILATSVAFGMIHESRLTGALAVLLGIFLSALYIKTRSLWMPIGFHLGWNVTSTFIGILGFEGSMATKWEVVLASHAFTVVLLTLLVLRLPLRPHPRDRELWDRYVKPAPWPPWRRAKEASSVRAEPQNPR